MTRLTALLLAALPSGCATARHATALEGQGAGAVSVAAAPHEGEPARPEAPAPAAPPEDDAAPGARLRSPREGRDARSTEALRARLAGLPRCPAGVEVGQLHLATTTCTRMACRERCCNACRWRATLTTKRGEGQAVDERALRSLLALPEQALECEVAVWREALHGVDLGLEAGCAVR